MDISSFNMYSGYTQKKRSIVQVSFQEETVTYSRNQMTAEMQMTKKFHVGVDKDVTKC
jgi:hypothetical protein